MNQLTSPTTINVNQLDMPQLNTPSQGSPITQV